METVPVIIPSFKLNFMAARTIETIDQSPYVLHVAKSKIALDQRQGKACICQAIAKSCRFAHHFVIEDILARRYFPDMPGDLVIFMDHDYAWNPGCFRKTIDRLLGAMRPETKIAWLQSSWMHEDASGDPYPFHTCPMFVARRCKHTTMHGSWLPNCKWPSGDSGWGLAKYLKAQHPGSVVSVEFNFHANGFHIGGYWHNTKFCIRGEHAFDCEELRAKSESTTLALVGGQFHPKQSEQITMCESGVFHKYLREHMNSKNFTEYDNCLYPHYRSDEYYISMWHELQCLQESLPRLQQRIDFLLSGKQRYIALTKQTRVPWYVIGSIHAMEAGDEDDPWLCSLHNGLPWNEKNIHAIGKPGPFASFEEAALHVLRKFGPAIRNVVGVSRYLETWNGVYKFKSLKMHSPYLYAHSNKLGCYGKFKRLIIHDDGSSTVSDKVTYADKIGFVFVRDAFNNQIGSIVAIKAMHENGLIQIGV